ncbi:MAG TPA: GAF domain-containing protein [Chthoniobacterales bacterium]|nr:GAF domain-containing protein [Chthoniobacterales bacterium]
MTAAAEESGREKLLHELRSALAADASPAALQRVLEMVLAEMSCPAGTIHVSDAESHILQLTAHRGIPDVVLEKVRTIPFGKGMAGIAVERREPVQVCNLQRDSSGVVQPGAKDTKMAGSVAVPMIAADVIRGALGVAKPVPYDFSDAECDLLMAAGALIAEHLSR